MLGQCHPDDLLPSRECTGHDRLRLQWRLQWQRFHMQPLLGELVVLRWLILSVSSALVVACTGLQSEPVPL